MLIIIDAIDQRNETENVEKTGPITKFERIMIR